MPARMRVQGKWGEGSWLKTPMQHLVSQLNKSASGLGLLRHARVAVWGRVRRAGAHHTWPPFPARTALLA